MPKPKARVHTTKTSVFDIPETPEPKKQTRAEKRAEIVFVEQADMTPEQREQYHSIEMVVTSISLTKGLLFKLQKYVQHEKQFTARNTSSSSVIRDALEEFFNEK